MDRQARGRHHPRAQPAPGAVRDCRRDVGGAEGRRGETKRMDGSGDAHRALPDRFRPELLVFKTMIFKRIDKVLIRFFAQHDDGDLHRLRPVRSAAGRGAELPVVGAHAAVPARHRRAQQLREGPRARHRFSRRLVPCLPLPRTRASQQSAASHACDCASEQGEIPQLADAGLGAAVCGGCAHRIQRHGHAGRDGVCAVAAGRWLHHVCVFCGPRVCCFRR